MDEPRRIGVNADVFRWMVDMRPGERYRMNTRARVEEQLCNAFVVFFFIFPRSTN